MPPYEFHAQVTGPQDSVLSLSFSEKCRFLAAAGYDGVAVYDLKAPNIPPVGVPYKYLSPKDSKYMVSVARWVFFENTGRHVLLLGGLRGDLVAWVWNDTKRVFEHFGRALSNATSSQALSMHIHDTYVSAGHFAHLVVSCGDRSVTVWKLSSIGEFCKVFTTTLEPTIFPKTVWFDTNRNVYVFAYSGGAVGLLDRKSGGLLRCDNTGLDRMGAVVLDSTNNHLVISTGKDFQVFSISNLTHQRTLESSSPPVVMFPKQVAFVEENSRAVGGTDSGHAVVYDIVEGKIEQRFVYPKGGLVQTVASFDADHWHYVALAGSTAEQAADILLFRKKRKPKTKPLVDRISFLKPSLKGCMILIGVLMASLGFEYLRRTYQPTVSITWQSGDSSHSSNDLPSTPAIPPKSTRYPKQKLEKFTASRLAETEDPVTEDCSRDVRDPDVSPDSNSKKSNPPPPSANEDPADETESHDSDMNREGCDTATGAVLVRKQDPRLVGVGRCNFGVYEYEERY